MASHNLIPCRSALSSIEDYHPGHSFDSIESRFGVRPTLKLSSNENPLGAAIDLKDIQDTSLSLYPDTNHHPLSHCLSFHHSIDPSQLILTNGSDECFQLLALAYLNPEDEVISSEHTFSVYKTVTHVMNARYKEAPMRQYLYDLTAFLPLVTSKTKLIFIANPNNPTGTLIPYTELVSFLKQVPKQVIVVLDEAYRDYITSESIVQTRQLLDEFPNVVITRTYSKLYGLAGLRIGYGLASSSIIRTLLKVKPPFNVNQFALQAAYLAQTTSEDFVKHSRAVTQAGIADYETAAQSWPVTLLPSEANFICLLLHDHSADALFEYFIQHGIIIRQLRSFGLPQGIRITVGNKEQTTACISLLTRYFNQGTPTS